MADAILPLQEISFAFPVNALKEKGELFLGDLCSVLAVHGPRELVFLQALQPHAEPVSIPVNDFQDLAQFVAEQK